jgi:hypothetical protein
VPPGVSNHTGETSARAESPAPGRPSGEPVRCQRSG